MIRRLLLIPFITALASRVQAEPASLADYQAHYATNLARIEAAYPIPETEALEQYAAGLQQHAKALQRAGDLEVLLIIRNEIARFQSESSVPAQVPPQATLAMRQLHYRYHSRIAKASIAQGQRVSALLKSYGSALEALQKKQVQASQLEAALLTRTAHEKSVAEAKTLQEQMAQTHAAFNAVQQELQAAMPAKPHRAGSSGASRIPPAVLRDRVLHYTFDRDEREKVSDRSGKGNHGSVHGAKWVRNGKIGGGMQVDFKSSYVTIPTDTVGNWEALSYSIWVKVPEYRGRAWPAFIGASTRTDEWNVSLGIAKGTGKLYVEVDTEKGNRAILGGSLAIPWDTWFHAAMVYDGSTLTEYLNGKPGASKPASGALLNITQIHLGRGSSSYNPSSSLVGQLDEAIIFNRALTADEVAAIYRAQK